MAQPAPPVAHRFYGSLAPWWPLVSPPTDYTDEAAWVRDMIASCDGSAHTVLELGSGGGSLASHLTADLEMTLVDWSSGMLAVSAALNPTALHAQGDMRTVRLDRDFDVVLVHDAVDYMLDEQDLALLLGTAFVHCRPGGAAIVIPDHTKEAFAPSTDHGGSDGADGRGVRYLEWTTDPDPTDSWIQTEYAFVLRDTDGQVSCVHETHRTGLFEESTWTTLMRQAGFEPRLEAEPPQADYTPRTAFIGRRPG